MSDDNGEAITLTKEEYARLLQRPARIEIDKEEYDDLVAMRERSKSMEAKFREELELAKADRKDDTLQGQLDLARARCSELEMLLKREQAMHKEEYDALLKHIGGNPR